METDELESVRPSRGTLLVVDDDAGVLRALHRALTQHHFRAVCVSTAEHAQQLMRERHFDVVVSDLRLPLGDGTVFAAWATHSFPETPVIVLTGDDSLTSIHKYLSVSRVEGILPKPIDFVELESLLETVIHRQGVNVASPHLDARHIAEGLLRGLALRDVETEGHSRRVAEWTRMLGVELGIPHDAELDWELGGLLHDIGKIGVPDAILCKPGKLTEDEWGLMRRHPQYGFALLASIPLLARTTDIVLYHHERWDGGGYPHGLAGEKIPLGARAFAISDTYDAMTSARPYRKALDHAAAVAELRKQSGTQFDPRMVEAFLAIDDARWELVRSCYADPPPATA